MVDFNKHSNAIFKKFEKPQSIYFHIFTAWIIILAVSYCFLFLLSLCLNVTLSEWSSQISLLQHVTQFSLITLFIWCIAIFLYNSYHLMTCMTYIHMHMYKFFCLSLWYVISLRAESLSFVFVFHLPSPLEFEK